MEARKWDELPMDCLLNVLGRVGVGRVASLLFGVPFVCKTWYQATLSPICWKELDFPHISEYILDPSLIPFTRKYRLHGLIRTLKFLKVVVDRSAGCATMVTLPNCYTYAPEAIFYVSENCPALKKLVLISEESCTMLDLSIFIGKFKNLESLEIRNDFRFKDIVIKIGVHCVNFVSLSLVPGVSEAYIGEEEAMTIVTCLSKIKCLALRELGIERENLIKILKGCVELVHLDIRDCRGFDIDDYEILMLASLIPTFGYS